MFGKTTFRSLLDSDKKSLDRYFSHAKFLIGAKGRITDENTTNYVLLSDREGVVGTMSLRIAVTSHLDELDSSFLVSSLSLRDDLCLDSYLNSMLLYAWREAFALEARYLYFFMAEPKELDHDFVPAATLGLYSFLKPEEHIKDLYVKVYSDEEPFNPGFMTAI